MTTVYKAIRCPNCGKFVEGFEKSNLIGNVKFVFAVHQITMIKGRRISFAEKEGCLLTKEQFEQIDSEGGE